MGVPLKRRAVVVGNRTIELDERQTRWMVRSLEQTESWLRRHAYERRLSGETARRSDARNLAVVTELIEFLIGDADANSGGE